MERGEGGKVRVGACECVNQVLLREEGFHPKQSPSPTAH